MMMPHRRYHSTRALSVQNRTPMMRPVMEMRKEIRIASSSDGTTVSGRSSRITQYLWSIVHDGTEGPFRI